MSERASTVSMPTKMKLLSRLSPAALALAVACVGPKVAPSPFAAFADAHSDSLATAVGFHQYDNRLEDRSAASIR